jgi:hypothetical protein
MELGKEQEASSGVGQLVNTTKITHGTIGKGVVNLTRKSNVQKVVELGKRHDLVAQPCNH